MGPSAEIDIKLDGEAERQKVDVKVDKDKRENLPLYFDGESVSGKVPR